jgi:hypothetical protein
MSDNTVVPFRKCANPKRYFISTCKSSGASNYIFIGLREGVPDNPVEINVAVEKIKDQGINHGDWINAKIQYDETVQVPYMDKRVPVLKQFEIIEPCPSETLRIVLNP